MPIGRRLRLPGLSATTEIMLQHPIYQCQLEGGYNPLVYQLQLKGCYNTLFTNANWKEGLRPPSLSATIERRQQMMRKVVIDDEPLMTKEVKD